MFARTSTMNRSAMLLMATWLVVGAVLSLWLPSNPLSAFGTGMTWLFFAGIAFTQWFNRAIFALFFAELILGGRGRIIEIHETLPIRLAIGMFLVLVFLAAWFADGKATSFELKKSRTCMIASVLGASTFFFFGLFLGNVYGNNPDFIVGDSRGFLFLAGALPLLFFASRRKRDFDLVVGCFLSVVTIFAIAKSFGYTLVLTGLMSIGQLGLMVEQYIPQEIGWVSHSRFILAPRFYMASDLDLMFVLPLLVSLALATKVARMRFILYGALCVTLFALISSQTRGLWVGALLGLAVVFWLSNVGSKFKIALVLPFILVVVLAASEDFLPAVRQTISTSFDINESSNRGRLGQFAPLMDMARKHIVLGNGFGAYAHDYPGPDPKQPYGYELQAMNFLMKMGIVGCVFWTIFLAWILHSVWRIYKRAADPSHRVLAKGLLGALVGMLFASATNPYFSTSVGMGCLLFTVIVVDLIGQRPVADTSALSVSPKESGILHAKHARTTHIPPFSPAPRRVRF